MLLWFRSRARTCGLLHGGMCDGPAVRSCVRPCRNGCRFQICQARRRRISCRGQRTHQTLSTRCFLRPQRQCEITTGEAARNQPLSCFVSADLFPRCSVRLSCPELSAWPLGLSPLHFQPLIRPAHGFSECLRHRPANVQRRRRDHDRP